MHTLGDMHHVPSAAALGFILLSVALVALVFKGLQQQFRLSRRRRHRPPPVVVKRTTTTTH
jgi:hypothetical protein